jgi:hypothetical protein
MHEPGLREIVTRNAGLFYIGVASDDEAREYAGLDRVAAFVTEGPLDFVPRVMHDWNGSADARDTLFDKGDTIQIAALTKTLGQTGPYGDAEPAPSSLVQRALERSFPDRFLPTTSLISDIWSVDDKLGYQPFADAIAVFLLHKDTRPPLTVGIRAPWGAGKTSLMRMIRNALDPPGDDGKRSAVRLRGTEGAPAGGPRVGTVLRVARRRYCASS